MSDYLRPIVFRDHERAAHWRVEKRHDDGTCEMTIFGGSAARERALLYAGREYGDFVEMDLAPYARE